MGQLPGIFYACFNLFWLGEEAQTLRDKAKAGAYPVAVLNDLLGTLWRATRGASRSGTRSTRWSSSATSSASWRGPGCASHDEFRRLTESLLVAIDRIQAWVDRMISWHTLDANLELVP